MVDRRADYAEMLAGSGDLVAAESLLADALEIAPHWAAGWFRLGEWREALGERERAAAAFREAVDADPDDRLGASLKLELLGERPTEVPAAFVETLFDQYADTFEDSLLAKLDYRAPELLLDAMKEVRALPAHRVLDLGCGTGLMGIGLRAQTGWLEGMDLSAAMLGKAREKGIYDRLVRGDITKGEYGRDFDLVIAADVFMYVGRLRGVFAYVEKALVPGGFFSFSVEKYDQAEFMSLRDSRRYAHGRALVARELADAGFEILTMSTGLLRRDRDLDIEGLIVVARKP